MTKTIYHRETRQPIIVDDDANMADWPEYVEVRPPMTQAELDDRAANFRKLRNLELARTDHLVLPDRPVNPEVIEYRQQLRDATNHPNWPLEFPPITRKFLDE